MFEKSVEYWAVLVGMVLYIMSRDSEREPLLRRVAKTLSSALLAFGLSPSLAPYTRGSEMFAAIAVMAFALIALDTATALIGDRQFIKDVIRRRVGGADE